MEAYVSNFYKKLRHYEGLKLLLTIFYMALTKEKKKKYVFLF